MIIHLRFYETEHQGDLHNYIEELTSCGATVLESELFEDQEEAVVKLETADFKSFKTAWEQTAASDFADSLGWLEVPNA